MRPADAVETAECWALALAAPATPSVIALTRQGVPPVRQAHTDQNLCAQGAYELAAASQAAMATIFATGSEVMIAMAARETLEAEGTPTRVISVPCQELFVAQDEAYRARILGRGTVRVAVEAASPFGWERFVGEEGAIVALSDFGASAPADELYEHFGITAAAVAEAVRRRLN